jgi:polyphosphate kinase 2 (PPK2 family)
MMQRSAPRLADVDLSRSLPSKAAYKRRLDELQLSMLRLQQSYFHLNLRAVVVFEGWDAGGKGGSIRRLTEKLDPRGVRVHAIGPPTPDEQSRHFLYRFWRELPVGGHIAIFDRSWYGRVLVERVERLTEKPAWERGYDQINAFEKMLIDDGIRLVKIFLHISADEQLKRFHERIDNPLKRWKITRDDIRARRLRSKYERAVDEMFTRTSTSAAPWFVIPANKKWFARTTVLDCVTSALAEGLPALTPYDKREIHAVREALRKL